MGETYTSRELVALIENDGWYPVGQEGIALSFQASNKSG
jgi:predicted RNA binding protein YcfA (HicA-like mRNA interferase family)